MEGLAPCPSDVKTSVRLSAERSTERGDDGGDAVRHTLATLPNSAADFFAQNKGKSTLGEKPHNRSKTTSSTCDTRETLVGQAHARPPNSRLFRPKSMAASGSLARSVLQPPGTSDDPDPTIQRVVRVFQQFLVGLMRSAAVHSHTTPFPKTWKTFVCALKEPTGFVWRARGTAADRGMRYDALEAVAVFDVRALPVHVLSISDIYLFFCLK